MPIKPSVEMQPISREDFHTLDYEVMGIAFAIHNDFGRFWNEKIYQNELADRCQKAGFENVATEVPIEVSDGEFSKIYKIDLLINNVIYELKTVDRLASEHEKQAINYLMLTGLSHAKLVNMRPTSVQHRFVTTNITPQKRYNFAVDDENWRDLDESSVWLKRMFQNLLNEWGVFLDIALFYEAFEHFRGGKDAVVKELEIWNGSRLLGRQKAHLIAPDVAFKISAVSKDQWQYETHFLRFLRYTSLQAIHWINFNREQVVFKTIIK